VVLVRSDPRDVPRIVEFSRATYRKMGQNLWWAAGYNIIAMPLAAGVLQPWGVVLNPAAGAVLMSASTVIVAITAQLLRRQQWSTASVRRAVYGALDSASIWSVATGAGPTVVAMSWYAVAVG
jgi:hypothetical protein